MPRRPTLKIVDPYEQLARDYDWLLDDEMLRRGAAITQPAVARLLEQIPATSSLLDAACGTGVDAAVLAHRDFRVVASDGSAAMVKQAEERFGREGLAIPVSVCLWRDLSTTEPFDVVLCVGNSLVHAAYPTGMFEAIMRLREVTRRGGHIVIDSRNWEKLHHDRQAIQVAPRAIRREGLRCVPLYAWEIPDSFEDEHVAHLVLIFDHDGIITSRHHVIRFRPFRFEDLIGLLNRAELMMVDSDFDHQTDRYSVIARR